jgi:elongation factor 1 alpha-like protein
MDWSEARFEEIKAKLGTFLVQAGFRKSKLYFVPVSGLTGENLVARSANSPLNNWYNGQTLVDHVGKIYAHLFFFRSTASNVRSLFIR